MIGRAAVCRSLLLLGLLVPLRGHAQALRVYGPDRDAQACFESAKTAVARGETVGSTRGSCTAALDTGDLSTQDRAATRVNRGILSMALQEFDAALLDFDAAEQLYPRYGAIYVNRGNVFFLRDAYDRAIAEYTRALASELDERQVAYLNRGMAHETLGHWDAAEADYQRALKLAPGWGLAMSKLARVLGKRK